tara:strand:+ start:80 stop:724 length:645 start_codon:yes stop_codon:yes gene_type:complete
MSNDKGATGSDAGWENTQSNKDFNKGNTWTGKSDSEVKTEIKQREDRRTKEKEFIESGKIEGTFKSPFMLLNLGVNAGKDLLNKGSVKTRTFFSNSVLSKKGVTYKGTKYSKTQFQNLSVEKQNEIYSGYLEGRLSNKTDAYGNPNPGYNKGGDGQNQVRKTEKQIETESEEETKKDERTEEEKEDEYKKVKGLKGARSMFGNAGGRGYFDPAR